MRRSSRTVSARIHQLSGQLNAVESMIQQRRSCADVLQQLSAVRAGLESVAGIVFQTEIQKLASKKQLDAHDVEKLTQLFSKTT